MGLIGQGPGSGGSSKDAHGLTRKNLRTRSQAIKALVDIVGTSGKIYSHLIDLCKVRGPGQVCVPRVVLQPLLGNLCSWGLGLDVWSRVSCSDPQSVDLMTVAQGHYKIVALQSRAKL